MKYLLFILSFFVLSCAEYDGSDGTIPFNEIVKNKNGKYIIKDSGELVNGTVSVIGFSDYAPKKLRYADQTLRDIVLENKHFKKLEANVVDGQFTGKPKYFVYQSGEDGIWREVNLTNASDWINPLKSMFSSGKEKTFDNRKKTRFKGFYDREISKSQLQKIIELNSEDYISKKIKVELFDNYLNKKFFRDYIKKTIRKDSKFINSKIKRNKDLNSFHSTNLLFDSFGTNFVDFPHSFEYFNGEGFYNHGFERGAHVASLPLNVQNEIIQDNLNIINLRFINWGAYFFDFQNATNARFAEAIERTNLFFPSYYKRVMNYPDKASDELPEGFWEYTRVFDPRDKDSFEEKVDKIVDHFYDNVFGEHLVGYSLSKELEDFFMFYIEAHDEIHFQDEIFKFYNETGRPHFYSGTGYTPFPDNKSFSYDLNYISRDVETSKTNYSSGFLNMAISKDIFIEGKFNFGPKILSKSYLQTSKDYVQLNAHSFDENDKYCYINFNTRTNIESQDLFTFFNNLKNKGGEYDNIKSNSRELDIKKYNEALEELIKQFTERHDRIFTMKNIINHKYDAKDVIKNKILLEEDVFIEDGVYYLNHNILPSYSKTYHNLENFWITNPNIDYREINKELNLKNSPVDADSLVNLIIYNKN